MKLTLIILYFKTYFGQVTYDNILVKYFNVSKAYRDSFSLSEWHVYGNSRIGIYANKTNLVNVKFYSDVNNGSFTNVDTTAYYYATQSFSLFTLKRGCKNYELTNHLGNVLVVVTDKKIQVCNTSVVSYYIADVVSANDYSAFGAPLPNRSYTAPNSDYRFAFQGQYKDDEISGVGAYYAFTYRMYDARIGRFWTFDPLAPKYPHNSPYAFSENRVTNAIELEGLEAIDLSNKNINCQQTNSDGTTSLTLGDQEFMNVRTATIDGKTYASLGQRMYFDGTSWSTSGTPDQEQTTGTLWGLKNLAFGSLPRQDKSKELPWSIKGSSYKSTKDLIADTYKAGGSVQNPGGVCYALTGSRTNSAFKSLFGKDALNLKVGSTDMNIMGTTGAGPSAYNRLGVPGALANRGLATIINAEDVWNGALRAGDPLQIWWATGGHSIFFDRYSFDSNGKIDGIYYFDGHGFSDSGTSNLFPGGKIPYGFNVIGGQLIDQ